VFFPSQTLYGYRLVPGLWLYVIRVNWCCTSARILVDLRRCGVVFLGNAFSTLVSDTEMAAFITQLQ